ncbi:hypothetical protein, partial [Streptomyces monomycini]|uniref:hypothetical protein n=1 Tax=Streptomyces monomycini TaxID=371720 RepID=UPI0007C4F68C
MITTAAPTEDPGKSYVHNVALTRRRTLLAGSVLGGTALLLAGCSEDSGPGGGREDADAAADARLRSQAARDSSALLARYDATLAAHPGLGERLRPLRAEVARHAAAFGASPAPAASGGPSARPRTDAAAAASPSPASPASSAPSAPAVPPDEKQARTDLAAAERRTADARATALVSAAPELARLLASVAAAGAAHADL